MNCKARDWCFTLNNYTVGELEHIWNFSGRYIIFGAEKGENGTRHLQGYCEYENAVTMGRVKKDVSERVHLEKRRGTQGEAIDYCRKDGDIWEKGERRPGQGSRTDLRNVVDRVNEGKSLRDVSEEYPIEWIKYNRGIQSLYNMKETPKWRDITVLVYWGKTGTGKTRRAMQEQSVYKLNQNTNGTLWFDGYQGEECLLLDDFYGWIRYGELLTLLDGYPYRCQLKGGFCWAQWRTIIITSNKQPDEWYDIGDKSALKRRITAIREFE